MIELTSDMMTGVPAVDGQHQELFSRINAVVAMGTKSVSNEETRKTLDFLGEYVMKHFGDEESLQRKYGYDKYAEHKLQHQIYLDEFKKIKAEFAENGPSARFTVGLNASIINWIVRHIKIADVAFGKYCQEQAAQDRATPAN